MAFSSIIMLPLLLLFLAIWAGLIYLLILLIRALRKYLRGGEARREKAETRRPDLLEALKAADCVPLKTIEELRDIAYSIVGEPEKVQFGDRIVGIIEARDGTVMDVVREVKPFSFRED